MRNVRILACLGLLALLGCGDDDDGGTTPDAGGTAKTFTLALTPAAELPPCTGAGASATGSATVTISGDGSQISVTNLTFANLSGNATAAHIHFGSATTPSGPVVLNFGSNPTSPINKTFTASDYVAGTGAPATFAEFVTMARAGNAAYINVHTVACMAGEVRGELQ